ncbi:MAG: PQQ-binding-like beta-propeller repeat protein [Bacteroidota bacterium]
MNRIIIVIFFLGLVIVGGLIFLSSYPAGYSDPSTEEQIDSVQTLQMTLTSEVLKMNIDSSLVIGEQFRSGHVKRSDLSDYLTLTDDGYSIDLKHHSLLTSATVIGDTIYTSGGFGSKKYFAFGLESGQLIWAIDLDDDGPSPAVQQDSLLIFNTESCTIFAINRFSGEMVWSYWLGDPLLSTPMLAHGNVYTTYPNLTMYVDSTLSASYQRIKPRNPFISINAQNGDINWQKWLDGDVLVSPVAYEGNIFLTSFPGTVYKIDAKSGDILAAVSLHATSPPTIADGKVFVAKRVEGDTIRESIAVLRASDLAFMDEFHAVDAPHLDQNIQQNSDLKSKSMYLDAANGFSAGAPLTANARAAERNIGQSNVSSFQTFQASTIVYQFAKLFCLKGNTIYRIDAKEKTTDWTYRIDGDMKKHGGTMATTPLVTEKYVVTVSYTGQLLVLSTEDGRLLFEKDLKKNVRTAPVISHGLVFVPTTDGQLMCVDTKLPDLDGWGMFMKNNTHNLSVEKPLES